MRSVSPESRLALSIAAFVVVGAGLALVAWSSLSELLAGRVVPFEAATGIAAAIAFVTLSAWLARRIPESTLGSKEDER